MPLTKAQYVRKAWFRWTLLKAMYQLYSSTEASCIDDFVRELVDRSSLKELRTMKPDTEAGQRRLSEAYIEWYKGVTRVRIRCNRHLKEYYRAPPRSIREFWKFRERRDGYSAPTKYAFPLTTLNVTLLETDYEDFLLRMM